MSQGIHVFGSASMGALRAAELAAFGMEGVGSIYEAYREGQLEDDDEVAVAHMPAAYGYKCTSTAMVDIRATLVAAQAEGVISATARLVSSISPKSSSTTSGTMAACCKSPSKTAWMRAN